MVKQMVILESWLCATFKNYFQFSSVSFGDPWNKKRLQEEKEEVFVVSGS